MNNLRWIFLIIFFVWKCGGLNAQSTLTLDAGEVFSTYKYTDSQGQEKNFSNNITNSFNLGYQFAANSGVFIKGCVGMRKAGATLVYNTTNIDWTVQYVDACVGAGYVLNKWRIKPYIYATPYFAYMLKGEQTMGQYSYDIKANKAMSATDWGVFVAPGCRVALSNFLSFYVEYKQILGLQNLETTTGEKSYNRGFSINLGVAITFVKYNYVTYP